MAIRITAGEWRGRLLKVPRGNVRPAQDRVRLAVFSSLAGRVPGARVLDLFAGTGAYGLEALSRGAATAVWVEQDRHVLAALRENVAALCGPGVIGKSQGGVDAVRQNRELPFCRTAATPGVVCPIRLSRIPLVREELHYGSLRNQGAAVVAADALRFLAQGGDAEPYDLVFADPPYDRNGGWMKKILSALAGRSILKKSGLLVMEQSADGPTAALAGWQTLKRRVYGGTQIDYIAPS